MATSASDSSSTSGPRNGQGASAAAQRVVLIVLVLNILVAGAKAVYAGWSGSLAVGSDAVHSLTDSLSNIVGFVALRMANRHPDARHPYGYQKVEIIAAAGIGVIIAFSAIEFGWGAVKGLIHGNVAPVVTNAGLGLLFATLVVNLVVATYERRRGTALQSPFLIADAAHTQSDVAVTVAVIGSQVAGRFGFSWADPLAALGVLGAVVGIAWRILGANIGLLLDRAVIDAAQIEEVVRSIPGVVGCHRVRSRGTEGAVLLDLHLTVDGSLPVRKAHEVSHRAEDALRARFSELLDVTIHVEPKEEPAESL